MADVWSQLAVFSTRFDRPDLAVDAYKHYIVLKPMEPAGYIGAAASLLKLRKLGDAREHATLAVEVAGDADRRSKASAHEMLARIALVKRDADTAREEARLAHEEDPLLPLPDYVDGRVLYDQGKYADALPLFLQAVADLKKPGAPQVSDLHFYAADTLGRLEQYPDAETQFIEELRVFPQNTRARGGLAMLYQASGQPDAAVRVVGDLMRITPTRDAYALAAKLYTMFGNRKEAAAVRAESRRVFADAPRSGTRATRR